MTRTADVTWEGDVAHGGGTITGESGALGALPYSLPTRVGRPDGNTSPEELIAAAHAGCFAMALSSELTKLGSPPERLTVSCRITLDEVGEAHRITKSELRARGVVPGVDGDAFNRAAKAAEAGCPVSAVLDAEITVDARLDEA